MADLQVKMRVGGQLVDLPFGNHCEGGMTEAERAELAALRKDVDATRKEMETSLNEAANLIVQNYVSIQNQQETIGELRDAVNLLQAGNTPTGIGLLSVDHGCLYVDYAGSQTATLTVTDGILEVDYNG